MVIRTISVFLDATGKRRGRVCLRSDGLYQFVTESVQIEDDGSEWWINSYPPSGLFDTPESAVTALTSAIGPMRELENTKSVEFDPGIGPYPDP